MDITRTTGRITAAALIYLLSVNPLLAAGLAVDSSQGGNTALDQAGNGVPIVNIATPNGNGLSHNRFTDFNVAPEGLILNNSTERLSQSQLGGLLQNNPNLNGGSASLILNEVTGTSRSLLQGYTEVFGQQAGVIVANPYGITCNGCGFINTPRATLTTGAPILSNGQLTGLDVNGGSIAIEGLGLNADNTDQFDIITRALTLNAEINANNLNVVTGRNQVNYNTLSAVAKSPDNSQLPTFALDASALGGMYANRIYMMGTEAGVGVRSLASMAASGGDITLDVNGNLILDSLSASQDIALTSQGDLSTAGNVYAANNLRVSTEGAASLQGTTAAGTDLTFNSGSLNQQGTLASGLNQDGSFSSNGVLTIETGALNNSGVIRSASDLTIAATEIDNRNARLLSDGTLGISAASLDNQGGQVDAAGAVNITLSGELNNAAGTQASLINSESDSLSISSGSINNTGSWLQADSGQLSLSSSGDLMNRHGRVLGQQVQLSSGELDNSDGVIQGNNTSVTASRLDNSRGLLTATQGDNTIAVQNQTFNTEGRLSAENQLSLTSGWASNESGEIVAGTFRGQTDNFVNRDGLIEASEQLQLTSVNELNNTEGVIRSLGEEGAVNLTASGDFINRQGEISANNTDLTISGARVWNEEGTVNHAGHGALSFDGSTIDNRDGRMAGNGEIQFSSELSNTRGLVSADQILFDSGLTNVEGTVEADKLTFHGSVYNAGGRITQYGTDDQIIEGYSFSNASSSSGGTVKKGIFQTNAENITIRTDSLTNHGAFTHAGGGALTLETLNGWMNTSQGELVSNGDISLSSADSLHNDGGTIVGDDINITSATGVDNRNGQILARENLTASSNQIYNRDGTLAGDIVQLTESKHGIYNIDGVIEAREHFDIQAQGRIRNYQGAIRALGANGQSELSTASTLDNSNGVIEANNQNLRISANDLINNGGRIVHAGTGELIFDTTRLNNSNGRITANGLISHANGERLNQQGLISGAQVSFNGSGALDNTRGAIEADQLTLAIDGHLTNNGGRITQFGATEQTLSATGITNGVSDVNGTETRGRIESNASNLTINSGTGDLVNQGDLVLASDGLLTVLTTAFNNALGRVLGNGDVTVVADSINNQGGVIAGESLSLTTTNTLANSGVIEARQNLQLTAGTLDNTDGTLRSVAPDGWFSLDTGGLFNNTRGLLELNGPQLMITANQFNNSDGVIRQSSSGQATFLVTQDLVNIDGQLLFKSGLNLTAASFNNTDGRLHGTGGLNLTLGGLNNTGGLIYNDNSSNFVLGLSGTSLNNSGGRLVSRQALQLNAANLNNANGLVQAGSTLTLNLPNYTNAATSRLLFADSFTMTTGNFTNYGQLATNGDLTLNLSGQLTNHNILTSLGDMSISASAFDNKAGAKITAGGSSTFSTAGSFNNSGLLTSTQSMNITGSSISNAGTLGAGGDLTIHSSGAITNTNGTVGSLMFSAGAMSLYGASLYNRYSDIYSVGNLRFARNSGLGRAGSFTNRSGQVESQSDIGLWAENVLNTKDIFGLTEAISSGRIEVHCFDCGGDHYHVDYILTEKIERTVTGNSPLAQLVAGRNLSISASDVSNQHSLISASNNITINTGTLLNEGSETSSAERVRRFDSGRITDGHHYRSMRDQYIPFNEQNSDLYLEHYYEVERCTGRDGDICRIEQRQHRAPVLTNQVNPDYDSDNLLSVPSLLLNYAVRSDVTTATGSTGGTQAVIQAGNTVSINASGAVTNGVIREQTATSGPNTRSTATSATGRALEQQGVLSLQQAGQTETGSTLDGSSGQADEAQGNTAVGQGSNVDGTKTVVFINSQPQAGDGFDVVDPLEVPGFQLPQSEYGLFTRSTEPNHPYLIETNPAFADYTTFISSDYMLERIGYNTNDTLRRLGDGFYEQQLIRQAIVAQTGQRFLTSALTSDYDQYVYLMNNAVASQDALNLSLGVALSAAQVAALTHDIVWLVEREVEGQTVLVPTLYLAQTRPTNIQPNGALIAGRNVNLIGGDTLENLGTLAAMEDLNVQAVNTITNTGITSAGRELSVISTQGSIVNKDAGLIKGDRVNLIAAEDIRNERQVVTHQWGREFRGEVQTITGDASRIEAGEASLQAGRDIAVLGSDIDVEGRAALQAGRDVTIASVEDREQQGFSYKKYRESKETIRQLASNIEADNLQMVAGSDITVAASRIETEGDLKASAGNNLNILAAANEDNYAFYYKSSSKKITHEKESARQQGAELIAGGNVNLQAGDTLLSQGSAITAEGEANLTAGENLALVTAQNREYELYEKKKKGSFGRKSYRKSEQENVQHQSATVEAGDDIILQAGDNIVVRAGKLTSDEDITLTAGNVVVLGAEKNLTRTVEEKSKTGTVWQSAKGEGKTDETTVHTELLAGGTLTINAQSIQADLKAIDGKNLQQSISQLSQNPELAWMAQLENDPRVNWNQIQEIHDQWDYESEGLAPAAAIVISIAVAWAVGPYAASWATTTTGAAAGTTTVASAAVQAGYMSIASQASVSLINNKGNLGAVFKELGSSDAIKSIATAMITAGALQHFNVDVASAEGLEETAIQIGKKTVIQASVDTAVNGGSLGDNLVDSLQANVVQAGAAEAAEAIGDATDSGSIENVAAHTALGCIAAEAGGKDCGSGALGGAVGATLSPVLGEQLRDDNNPLTDQQQNNLTTLTELSAAVTALLAGKDVDTAAAAAKNEVLNNYLKHSEMRALAKALKGCEGKGFECRKDAALPFLKIAAENQEQLSQVCQGGAKACSPLDKERIAAVNAFQSGEIEGDLELNGDDRQLLLAFHMVNLQSGQIASEGVTQYQLRNIVQALGLSISEEKVLALSTLVSSMAHAMKGKKGGATSKQTATNTHANNKAPANANSTSAQTDDEAGTLVERTHKPITDPSRLLENPARNKYTGEIDKNYMPPEDSSKPIVSYPAPQGMRVNMAVNEKQLDPVTGQVHPNKIGGFTTKDSISSVEQVHTDLAVKSPDWGPKKTHVQEFEIKVNTRVQESVVGKQVGDDGKVYVGGGNQVEPLIPQTERRKVLTPIGPAKPLPEVEGEVDASK